MLPRMINPRSCKKRCYSGFGLKWCAGPGLRGISRRAHLVASAIPFDLTSQQEKAGHINSVCGYLVSREGQGKYEGDFKRSSSKKQEPACSLEAVNNGVLEAKIKCALQFEKKTKLSSKSPVDSVGKLDSVSQETVGT